MPSSTATSPTDSQGSSTIITTSPATTTTHYSSTAPSARSYPSRNSLAGGVTTGAPSDAAAYAGSRDNRYRASIDASGLSSSLGGSLSQSQTGQRNWPHSRAGGGNTAAARPTSELLGGHPSLNTLGMNQFASPES